jgi:non-ribosomal peptide synthetase component E (peptide arylation enzyme)
VSHGRVVRWRRLPGEAERYRELGLWGDLTLAEVIDAQAARHPERLAVADDRAQWSYAEFVDRADRLARILLDLGVREGDAVVTQLPNCALLPLAHLAALRIGAIWVPMSTAWRAAELGSMLDASEAAVVLAVPRDKEFDLRATHRAVFADRPRSCTALYFRGEDDPTLPAELAADPLLSSTAPLTPEEVARYRPDPDGPALAMVSSGTTGLPKAGLWGGNDLVALLLHHLHDRLGLGDDEVAAAIAPANLGSTGYVYAVLASLLHGGTCHFLERWSAQAALDLLVRERCTWATAIAPQMRMMLDLPLESADLSAFTRFNNGGAPLSGAVAQEVERRMDCVVQTSYGTSDGGCPSLTSIDDPDDARWTSVGRILDGMEVELRDPLGEPVGPGEVGEICWRGVNKSFGYLNQPEYEAAVWDDRGWARSGDLGTIDADGYLRIVGRAKEMILRGGANIFPSEIEAALVAHPQVRSVAVVAVPDERLGERACAVVVPIGAAPTLPELVDHLGQRGMARFKHPEFLLVVDELPINAGGKVDRIAVRAHAERSLVSAASSRAPA